MATRAESLRILVAEYDAEGVSPATIGGRLGISVARVEEILDQLDESDGRPAHQDDEQRAPAVIPLRPEPRPVTEAGPIAVGSPARAPKTKPVVEVHPVPDVPEPTDDVTTSELLITDQQRADIEALRAELAAPARCGQRRGTYAGYQWHSANDDMPPCESCRDARRKYDRDLADRQKSGGIQPRRRVPAECGTLPAYYRHRRNKEDPCDPCKEAWREYKRDRRAKDGQDPTVAYEAGGQLKPGIVTLAPVVESTLTLPRAQWDPAALAEMRKDAVAFLLMPLSIPRLVAVADALEMAYGPDLNLVEGPGGMWVLRRAS